MATAEHIRIATDASVATGIAGLAAQLNECLGELHGLVKQLGDNAAAKLAAMRRADAATLQQLALDEEDTLRRTAAAERRRSAILAALAQALHWPQARGAKLDELAARIPEPAASQIRARNTGLRAVAENLRKNTRLVADVARSLQTHIRAVLDELAGAHLETVRYGANGTHERTAARTWVDALG